MGTQVCGRFPLRKRVSFDRPPLSQPFTPLLNGTCPGLNLYGAPALSPRRSRQASGLAM